MTRLSRWRRGWKPPVDVLGVLQDPRVRRPDRYLHAFLVTGGFGAADTGVHYAENALREITPDMLSHAANTAVEPTLLAGSVALAMKGITGVAFRLGVRARLRGAEAPSNGEALTPSAHIVAATVPITTGIIYESWRMGAPLPALTSSLGVTVILPLIKATTNAYGAGRFAAETASIPPPPPKARTQRAGSATT